MLTTITLTPAIDITIGATLFDSSCGPDDAGDICYGFSTFLTVTCGDRRIGEWVDGTLIKRHGQENATAPAADSDLAASLLDGIHELLGDILYFAVGQQVAEQALAAAAKVWESEVAPTLHF